MGEGRNFCDKNSVREAEREKLGADEETSCGLALRVQYKAHLPASNAKGRLLAECVPFCYSAEAWSPARGKHKDCPISNPTPAVGAYDVYPNQNGAWLALHGKI